jgi:D-glycero-D-manno-heptose 1,7-bisphosphate phosphatase
MVEKQILQPAVFLDRDGTITPEIGYIVDPAELTLLPGAVDAVKNLRSAGFKLILITNQSAVAREMMDIKTLETINKKLMDLLEAEGTTLDGLYYCPHHPTEGKTKYTRVCECRKPAAGLFLRAADENAIDLKKSYLVGDKLADISMAPALGAKGILVKTGYGRKELELITENISQDSEPYYEPDFIADDISVAAEWIISQSN